MPHFTYYADFGRGGTNGFQISQLEMDGVDVPHQIDQGKHFNDEDELCAYLAEDFGLPLYKIDLECIGSDDSSKP